MRMWGVDPQLLCNKHLLGEHVEMHMFMGAWNKDKSLRGYVEGGLVELDKLLARHDILAAELLRRGMAHQSPLIAPIKPLPTLGKLDLEANLADLCKRCIHCARRILG